MIKDRIICLLDDHKDEMLHFQISSLFLFGSVARGEDTVDSDVDILVEFTNMPSFDLYMDLKLFLEELLSCKVDLVTTTGIRSEIKQYIQKDLIRVA